jgi:hypothetical protein
VLVKTKEPKAVVISTARDDTDYNAMLERVKLACDLIESGAFNPCSPDHWGCSAKWCGYWQDVCPFGRRSRSLVSLNVKATPPPDRGRRKKAA